MRGAFLIATMISLLIAGMLVIKRQSSIKAAAKTRAARTGQPAEPDAEALARQIKALNKSANDEAEKSLQQTED